jgi:hypothetical protein
LCDVTSIPILTMGQRNNDEWERLRNNRLTASNFGRIIINMKLTTDTANTIKDILCRVGKSKFKKLPELLQWGIDNEEKAKQKFEEVTGLNVSSCGLFVDTEKKFLGASPDGLVDLDSIVEIKSPFAARNTDIKTAIEKKIIKYLEIDPRDDDKILLKENDNYMYQVYLLIISYPTSTRRHGNFAGVHTLLRIILSSNSAVLINIITGVSPPHFDFFVFYVLCQC